ncbi:MAG: insulinase family protein [Candidatus Poribacteria bacterium]|nr:insulinase family protein [Candidatus Poribacteria bacterium]
MQSKQSNEHNPYRKNITYSQCPSVNLYPGQQLRGFEVKAVTPIDELRATAIELAHENSCARLLHLYVEDTRNWFSISPMTPAPDDTGVQHIVEHSVMSGSRNYPVRNVFFEMMKMSLASFDSTNAMNAVDHAYYYASSGVKKDLFNLAEVFFDSVFHALLTEQTFKREGHHLEPVDPNQPTGGLKFNGIVYNEVKSGKSDPRACFYLAVTAGLFPDTCYANNGGGDSVVMPNLTYEGFKTYYKTYFHPSNCYFFLYGNIPTDNYLEFLADKLGAIPKTEKDAGLHPLRPEISRQPKWKSAKTVRVCYPIGADEPLTEKTHLMLSWLIGDATDPEDTVLCRILSLLLFGNEGAPLRRAIIGSRLGTDVFDSGFMDGLTGPNSTFHAGLLGSEADRIDTFTELVLNTLAEIADADIDTETVEAAFQQLTYEYQEVTPKLPFQMMKRVINAWIYEKEPTLFLKMGACLSTIRKRWEQNPRIFNDLIRERLLNNPHQLTTVLSPDPGMQARLDANENQRLEKIRAQFSDEQVRQIAAEAGELERLNDQPNSPEDLAKLPQLQVADLPEKPLHIPTTVESVNGRPLLRTEVYSNGVNYVELSFDLQGLPQHIWECLPRYTNAVGKFGAGNLDYQQIAQRTAAATGGVECTPTFSTHALNPSRPVWNVQFRLKALDDRIEDAMCLLQDLVFAANPHDKERLYVVLNQAMTAFRTYMQGYRGPNIANHHAARGFSPQAYLSEIVFGLPQLRRIENLLNRFDECHEELSENLAQIRDFLLVRGRVTASFAGSDNAYKLFQSRFGEWVDRMRKEPVQPAPTGFKPIEEYPREGLAAPVDVAYCTQVMPAPHYSHKDSSLLTVGANIVAYDYAFKEIRLKGNAYYGSFAYNPFEGRIYHDSFADPHIARTLDVFSRTGDYVRKSEWTQTDIDHAIISRAGDFQKTLRPSQAAADALTNHLTGQTQEVIEEKYDQLRSATPKEVKRAMLQVLEENRDKASVCVVASREKLEAENKKMATPLSIEDI